MFFDYYLKKVFRRLLNQKWREVTTNFSDGKILPLKQYYFFMSLKCSRKETMVIL